MFHGRVRCEDPALPVEVKVDWIVQIHLDEVFVEAVSPTSPPSVRVLELSSCRADLVAHQARPGFRTTSWVKKMFLSFQNQVDVLFISSQVTEMDPFEHKGAKSSNAVVPFGKLTRLRVEGEITL